MTKEELYNSFNDCETFEKISEYLNEFFKSNICIPKGVNRHPYAYEIHAWAEGMPVEWRHNEACDWDTSEFDDYEYRIKPSEPVYEWQWEVGIIYGIPTISDGFYTKEEVGKAPFRKIEETKRERKQ